MILKIIQMLLSIAPAYGYVLITAACIAFECLLIGFIVLGSARRQVFSEAFMEQFRDVHKREVDPQSEPNKEGYPDMGSGVYAQRLSYGAWYRLNNAQRAHYNFVESIATIITLLLIGGVYHPIAASAFGLAYFIGRLLYTVGYSWRGATGRLIGVVVIDICLVALFVLCWITGINFIKGAQPALR